MCSGLRPCAHTPLPPLPLNTRGNLKILEAFSELDAGVLATFEVGVVECVEVARFPCGEVIVEVKLPVLDGTVPTVHELLEESRKERLDADLVKDLKMDNRLIDGARESLAQKFFSTARAPDDGQEERDAPGSRHDMGGDILDFDLMLYDCERPCYVGLNNEFISSGRIDDLSMAHAAIMAVIEGTDEETTKIAAIFDNEETGSGTKQGAASPVLANIIRRINAVAGGTESDFFKAIAKSFMISADNAHAFHPNYAEKYDPTNHPSLGGGPVIKINANCKYMTDAHSAAIFRALCEEVGVPFQYFVNHSDVAGGSTLGNILTSQIDIEGVDVGNPLLAMHSVRELGSVFDHNAMTTVFVHFFS